jgi:dCTP diphosphatase
MSTRRSVEELTDDATAFAHARAWEAFHDPKNLTMAIASEVGELAEILRWVANAESDAFASEPGNAKRIAHEIGDIGILLLLLCARLRMDLATIIAEKLVENGRRYPVEHSYGRSERPSDD